MGEVKKWPAYESPGFQPLPPIFIGMEKPVKLIHIVRSHVDGYACKHILQRQIEDINHMCRHKIGFSPYTILCTLGAKTDDAFSDSNLCDIIKEFSAKKVKGQVDFDSIIISGFPMTDEVKKLLASLHKTISSPYYIIWIDNNDPEDASFVTDLGYNIAISVGWPLVRYSPMAGCLTNMLVCSSVVLNEYLESYKQSLYYNEGMTSNYFHTLHRCKWLAFASSLVMLDYSKEELLQIIKDQHLKRCDRKYLIECLNDGYLLGSMYSHLNQEYLDDVIASHLSDRDTVKTGLKYFNPDSDGAVKLSCEADSLQLLTSWISKVYK